MNKVVLVGRLSNSPENTVTMDGVSITKFSLAVQKNKEEADFIRCIAFDKQAISIYNYCKKGFLLGVLGRIQTRSYERNGERRYVTEVIVDQAEFLTTKKESEQMAGSENMNARPQSNADVPSQSQPQSQPQGNNYQSRPMPEPNNFDDDFIPF